MLVSPPPGRSVMPVFSQGYAGGFIVYTEWGNYNAKSSGAEPAGSDTNKDFRSDIVDTEDQITI